MSSYAGGHNASRPQTNGLKNNYEEPKQKRRLGKANNEITGGGGGGGGGASTSLRSTNPRR